MVAYSPTAVTASATLSNKRHGDGGVVVNAAAGCTLTLPAASGSGVKFDIVIGTTVTSNSVILQVANSTDVMTGNVVAAADGGSTVNGWEAGAADDTITLNGTTTGGVKGDYITIRDIASGVWNVRMVGSATGTEATPFSSAV